MREDVSAHLLSVPSCPTKVSSDIIDPTYLG
jgi:hypothetical protein